MDAEQAIAATLLANGAVFLGSVVQATTGMGFAMVAAPLLALVSLDFVPGPMLLVNLMLSLLMLFKDRSLIVRAELKILLPMIAIGTAVGAVLLSSIPSSIFSNLFGSVILLAVAISLFFGHIVLSSLSLMVGGFISGLMGSTSGITGPPLAVLYQHEELSKARSTLAPVFAFSYVSALVALAITGKFSLDLAAYGLTLLPGLLMGFIFARRYRGLVSQAVGRFLMLSIATTSSVLLIANS